MKHYAGEVLYNAEGFLDKNRDSVGEACRDLLAGSSVPLVRVVYNDFFCTSIKSDYMIMKVSCPFRHSVRFLYIISDKTRN